MQSFQVRPGPIANCQLQLIAICYPALGSSLHSHYNHGFDQMFKVQDRNPMKLKEIASRLGARLEPSDADVEITGVAAIEDARPGQITYIADPRYAAAARTTKASAIIVDEKFPELPAGLAGLRSKNPKYAYARAVELFHHAPQYAPGVHPTAVIDSSARIGKGASIGACVVIEAGVEIGENCTLRPHVVIYRDVK